MGNQDEGVRVTSCEINLNAEMGELSMLRDILVFLELIYSKPDFSRVLCALMQRERNICYWAWN